MVSGLPTVRSLRQLVALALSGALACSNPPAEPAKPDATAAVGGDVSDVVALTDANIPVGGICAPGTTDGCFVDPSTGQSHQVVRCKADGSGWDTVGCFDKAGQVTECFNPGVCAECPKGKKRCNPGNSTIVDECLDGKWVEKRQCDLAKGEVCNFEGSCEKACDVNIKAKSYVGCAFWATDLDNAFVPGNGPGGFYDAAGAQYSVVVSNPSDKLSSVITILTHTGPVLYDSKGNPLDFSPLAPGDLRVFNLPPRNINATSIEPQAYRIESSVPIAAYQFNPLENVNVYSNDASLLLPEEMLDKWYIVMSREQSFGILRGFLTVVATQPGQTKVTVTFSETTGSTMASGDKSIKSFKPGESAEFTLERWDVLNIETDKVGGDLTGTEVLASSRVAVFAGSEAANVPNTNHCLTDGCSPAQIKGGNKCGVCEWDGKTACADNEDCSAFITCCADHLEMQMFPVSTWGERYVGVKLFPRGGEADAWRILAATDDTKIALNPPQKNPKGKPINIPVLDHGQWYEFESDCGPNYDPKAAAKGKETCLGGSFEIVASHTNGKPAPIMVGHFMASQDAPEPNSSGAQQNDAGTGDPAFLLAIPVEQWRTEYVFLTPGKYAHSYISIAAPADAEVIVDGAPLAPGQFQPISQKYKFVRLKVEPGTHVVKALPVGKEPRHIAVDVYGYDNYVSYGYPAGLTLKDLNLVEKPK